MEAALMYNAQLRGEWLRPQMSALLSLCASLLVNSWFEFNKIYWFYLTHREVCLLVFFYILFSCFFFFGLIFYVIFSPNPHASPFSPMINWICNRSIFFWRLRKHRRDRELFLLRLGGVLETLISLVLYVSLIAYNHIGSINNIGHPVCGSSFRFVIYSLILGLWLDVMSTFCENNLLMLQHSHEQGENTQWLVFLVNLLSMVVTYLAVFLLCNIIFDTHFAIKCPTTSGCVCTTRSCSDILFVF